MTNSEFTQHEDEADELNQREPCDGTRRATEEYDRLRDELFSYESVKERVQQWNRAFYLNKP